MKICPCGNQFKPKPNCSNWQKYCTRECWSVQYEKSGKKQTLEYKAKHKASTYRWRAKVRAKKIKQKYQNREQIIRLFKRGLRHDRYGYF